MTTPLSRLKSYTLVLIQFGALLALAATGPWIARHTVFLTMEIAALALGGWAVLTMRIRRLSALPDVRKGSRLVREGPYRWIRHPMYAAILLGALALVLDTPTPLRWGVYTVLAVDLLVKLHYEEQLLTAAFPAYRAYQKTSKRLIPFVY
ncbi:MAG: isoprenylcysteine carboxylmethyltransferase family protein [Caldilinea sp.]|nr:isoprenylcysteine carboxylmethyltransferase family protein [Caldilinea sp.]MDW8442024.1 isoprenylcysteine carboxylmethyltransferase family protein [Caldilineaceae bacterium]